MATLQTLLEEAERLDIADLQWLVRQLSDTLMHKQQKRVIPPADIDFFDQYCGIAHGLWGMDAQTYIDQLRDDDRL